ncbi:MAG: prefoldin subunit alpha [Euryarchaeota archaeon RBG_19FT_COMBO_56_21]|nr:MAG: prefoldin subunit alpha [Euryarchaeota archaeon RBG_19FT_COMBO_56_21]
MTPPQAVDDRKLQEDYMMLETAKAQIEGLSKQQQLIQLAVEEHVRARETVKSLTKGSPGDDVLVPIGADSFIHAKVSDNKTAVLGIGSGVTVRRSPEEAEKFLDEKIDELSRAFKSIVDRAAQTEALIQELSEKVQSQVEALRSAGKI